MVTATPSATMPSGQPRGGRRESAPGPQPFGFSRRYGFPRTPPPPCTPGAVPQLGNLFGLPVYLDEQLTHRDRVVFNAGSNAVSITMRSADLLRVSGAAVCRFARA